jgi:5-methylcytosine-specific restriction endonuclease McrA
MGRQDRAWLLASAKAVAKSLKRRAEGTPARIRLPSSTMEMDTDGWRCILGDLGSGRPRIELWLDRFSGHAHRKFFACLRAESRAQIKSITKRVGRRLGPVRVINLADTSDDEFFSLTDPLARSEFNAPILEQYSSGRTYYGIYDPSKETATRINAHFVTRAVAFFEDVIRSLPSAAPDDEQRDTYPRCENRKRVASHLRRERSKFLAAECKIRDRYKCQVCGFRFEEAFGRLGSEFAEAHHLVPLHALRENTLTQLGDLVTVCSNCHRMLHRMDGNRADLGRLRRIVKSKPS